MEKDNKFLLDLHLAELERLDRIKSAEKDKGSAELKITLKDGEVSMYHSDGTLLNKRPSLKGDWDKICTLIEGKVKK